MHTQPRALRLTKHRKPLGLRVGRPLKPGPRTPSGRLKPQKVEPNARTVELRRQLLGAAEGETVDLSKGGSPLDVALARGWISEERHRAAVAFARLYRQSRLGAPGLDSGGVHETEPTVGGRHRSISDMHSEDITAAWDSLASTTASRQADTEERTATAKLRWAAVVGAMTRPAFDEAFRVCIDDSWPQWIVWRAQGRDVPSGWDAKRVLLEQALDAVSGVLRVARAKEAEPRVTVWRAS